MKGNGIMKVPLPSEASPPPLPTPHSDSAPDPIRTGGYCPRDAFPAPVWVPRCPLWLH